MLELPFVAAHDEHHCIAVCGNIVLVRWLKSIRVPAVRNMQSILFKATQESPANTAGLVTMIAKKCDAPTAEARRALLDYDPAGRYVPHAILLEMDGFMGAVVRSVLAGLNLAKRVRYPETFFTDSSAAATWLESKMIAKGGKAPPQASITRSILWVREAAPSPQNATSSRLAGGQRF